jgi:hypothetical protein
MYIKKRNVLKVHKKKDEVAGGYSVDERELGIPQ